MWLGEVRPPCLHLCVLQAALKAGQAVALMQSARFLHASPLLFKGYTVRSLRWLVLAGERTL